MDDTFRKFRDKVYSIQLKKVMGEKLTSYENKLLRQWKEIHKIGRSFK